VDENVVSPKMWLSPTFPTHGSNRRTDLTVVFSEFKKVGFICKERALRRSTSVASSIRDLVTA
jgi:hypothetical protein